MRFKKGFTLIETMIVLIISALILGLTLLMDRHINLNHFRDFFFWEKFQNQLELAEDIALNNHQGSVITISHRGRVKFINRQHPTKARIIITPKNIRPESDTSIKILNDGHVNPTTVTWIVDGHTELDQAFQLGWGKYTFHYYDT